MTFFLPRLRYHIAIVLALALFPFGGCTHNQIPSGENATTAALDAPPVRALFKDVATQANFHFKHVLGDEGQFHFIEPLPPGCAFLDFDNDGNEDVFLVQSGSSAPANTVKNRPACALYRNLGNGQFKDVSRASGLDKDLGYVQGVAVGDFDNDGFDDLFVTAYGGNHLFRNAKGNGHFEDVTRQMALDKVHDTGYSTGSAWGDYDGDGRLDLYVCYYAHWNYALDLKCKDVTGQVDYCNPEVYEPITHQLFRNTGHGFDDVSERAGITKTKGRGLAVAFVDYNDDGKQDIFVANDMTPNMLWKNNGNGTFSNVASQAGCAFDGQGQDMASMGVAIADYNHSGRPSFYVSNFSDRPNILFQNKGNDLFQDATGAAGLSFLHLKFLSFGCEFLDYDADGWPDLVANNGHVQTKAGGLTKGTTRKQRKQLLHNAGNGQFREITETAELGDLSAPVVGRGLATGDFDNDGRVDILAVGQNTPVQLLRNQTGSNGNHFVSFSLRGTKSNRDGIGAKIELEAGGTRQTAWVHSGSSFLSSSDRRVYFGLGKATNIEQLFVTWPDGTRETLKNLSIDTFYSLTQTKGITGKSVPANRKSGN